MSTRPVAQFSTASPTYLTSAQRQPDEESSVIIHIQSHRHESTTVSKTNTLVQCRICQVEKYPDQLFSVHENCKKDICLICLPEVQRCPHCSDNIRQRPAQVQVLQTQRIEVVPQQTVVIDHTLAPQNPQILPDAPIPAVGANAAPEAQGEENSVTCVCVLFIALAVSLFAITRFIY